MNFSAMNTNEAFSNIPINDLHADLQVKINRALDDYRNGRYITHEQMKQKVEQWLPVSIIRVISALNSCYPISQNQTT